ncbi:MAG: sugar fermentation stimulation protein [Pseudomonadota bacterium]|jgi:sugar fermentation stimulation protein A
MQFTNPLQPGRLLKRYKRFLADIQLATGEEITASCPNTGSMRGLCNPGLEVWVSESASPTRKYRHTLEMVSVDLGRGPVLVGINTGHPNHLVTEAIENGTIAELQGYESLRREVKYGENSRIDIFLQGNNRPDTYVEIKNVHLMREQGLAEFPDSVTARGAKHLRELSNMVAEGHRAVMLFLIQRADAETFDLCRDIDAAYGKAFDDARQAGVEALAYRCTLSPEAIAVSSPVQFAC